MIYQFLLCKDFTEDNTCFVKEVYDMIREDYFEMSEETFNHLLNCCEVAIEYCSLEELIQEIKLIKDCNLSAVLQLYAKLDLARYNKLEQKKKAFGLK